ncbi:MAG TPA: hypothetical protein VIJ49_03625, partial [Aestuariivirga sp.]
MSLTQEIRSPGSRTRIFIDTNFPELNKLARELNAKLKSAGFIDDAAHATAILYAISGTAIDYRIRAYFSKSFYNF